MKIEDIDRLHQRTGAVCKLYYYDYNQKYIQVYCVHVVSKDFRLCKGLSDDGVYEELIWSYIQVFKRIFKTLRTLVGEGDILDVSDYDFRFVVLSGSIYAGDYKDIIMRGIQNVILFAFEQSNTKELTGQMNVRVYNISKNDYRNMNITEDNSKFQHIKQKASNEEEKQQKQPKQASNKQNNKQKPAEFAQFDVKILNVERDYSDAFNKPAYDFEIKEIDDKYYINLYGEYDFTTSIADGYKLDFTKKGTQLYIKTTEYNKGKHAITSQRNYDSKIDSDEEFREFLQHNKIPPNLIDFSEFQRGILSFWISREDFENAKKDIEQQDMEQQENNVFRNQSLLINYNFASYFSDRCPRYIFTLKSVDKFDISVLIGYGDYLQNISAKPLLIDPCDNCFLQVNMQGSTISNVVYRHCKLGGEPIYGKPTKEILSRADITSIGIENLRE